jgi:endonuclease/exonuclease/phosphatase (EEP) superfamily protein YafD
VKRHDVDKNHMAADSHFDSHLFRRSFGAAALTALLVTCVTPGPPRDAATLVITTHNIGDAPGHQTPSVEQVARNLSRDPSHVYLLQEVLRPEVHQGLLDSLNRLTGRHYHGLHASSLNLTVLSVYPVTLLETIRGGGPGERWMALLATVEGPKGSFVVANVHLTPVRKRRDEEGYARTRIFSAARMVLRETLRETPRSKAAGDLVERLAAITGPIVIGGDFNTIPSSRAIRTVRRHYLDAVARAGNRSGTYRRVTSRIRPRIDYLFFSSHFYLLEADVSEVTAGDHYPVVAKMMY